jgi:branched-chain amino acid transport system substrate-binding protein
MLNSRMCRVLVAASAIAATGALGVAAGAQQGAEILKLGAPLAATGADAREGALAKQGYDLWADTVNARGGIKAGGKAYRVQIVYYDDQSKPQTSAELTDRLVTQDHVAFLLGPYGSPATFADAGIADKYKVPMVDANGAAAKIFEQGYKYIFGISSPAADYAAAMLKAAVSLSPRPSTVAIITADDLFSLEVANGAKDWADQNGLRVVYFQKYPVGTNDLSAALTAVKAAGADVLIGSGHLQESLLAMRQAQGLEVNAKFFGFTVGPTTPDFVKALGTAAEYVFASSQWTPDVKYAGPLFGSTGQYSDAFTKRFGFEPDYHAANGSAGGLALQLAIQNAGGIDREQVRNALAALDVVTFYGRLKFNDKGFNTYKPMVTVQIQHGKVVTVWPANVAAAKAIYPTPVWTARK